MVERLPDGTIEFRFFRPKAHQVTLVGDFNGWDERSMPMIPRSGGWWIYRPRLAPGTYEFKYLADGQWIMPRLDWSESLWGGTQWSWLRKAAFAPRAAVCIPSAMTRAAWAVSSKARPRPLWQRRQTKSTVTAARP